MCIRDRQRSEQCSPRRPDSSCLDKPDRTGHSKRPEPESQACLLYTSDAADERSSVDLGGRRIIKKKTRTHPAAANDTTKTTPTQITNHQIHKITHKGETTE